MLSMLFWIVQLDQDTFLVGDGVTSHLVGPDTYRRF
jgi:hypothetical protein